MKKRTRNRNGVTGELRRSFCSTPGFIEYDFYFAKYDFYYCYLFERIYVMIYRIYSIALMQMDGVLRRFLWDLIYIFRYRRLRFFYRAF